LKKILIFGAGKSATELINYIGENSAQHDWEFIVADAQLNTAARKIQTYPKGKAVALDVTQPDQRADVIQEADIVISLLPPALHIQVARDCVKWKKNLLTASYIDIPLRELENEINNAGVLFLCEMGLDPGIDHMSAMELIARIKNEGGTIHSFVSHCGGLTAPENDDNPWHYKISWNPRNIVLAGAAGAIFKNNDTIVTKKYKEIFADCEKVNIPGLSDYAWYPNRDSLSYIPLYGLDDAKTFIRTTLRDPNFCSAWQKLVELDLTNPTDWDMVAEMRTYQDWIRIKLDAAGKKMDWQAFIQECNPEIRPQLSMLELDNVETLPSGVRSSADILQYVLEKKLILHPSDKDMIVMQHEIAYTDNQQSEKKIISTLIVKGTDQERTAMAKTVGLPLGIAAKLILEGKIKATGLKIPTEKDIYEPVLHELKTCGIEFKETVS